MSYAVLFGSWDCIIIKGNYSLIVNQSLCYTLLPFSNFSFNKMAKRKLIRPTIQSYFPLICGARIVKWNWMKTSLDLAHFQVTILFCASHYCALIWLLCIVNSVKLHFIDIHWHTLFYNKEILYTTFYKYEKGPVPEVILELIWFTPFWYKYNAMWKVSTCNRCLL